MTIQCATAQEANDADNGEERCEPFVATFNLAATSLVDFLHHIHLAVATSIDFQLLHIYTFPSSHKKASMEELCASNWINLLPPSSDFLASREMQMVEQMADLVTVVVTTSPMRSDPELGVLQLVFESLKLAGLADCRRILVCDHLNADVGEVDRGDRTHAKSRKKQGLKLGHVPAAHLARYRERLRNIRSADWARGVEVLELEEWHGFSRATERALAEVTTPLVILIQHDLAFLRPVNMEPVVAALLQRRFDGDHVHCVTFPRFKQRDYEKDLRLRTGLRVGSPRLMHTAGGVVALTRLPQFLDGNPSASLIWPPLVPLFHSLPLPPPSCTTQSLSSTNRQGRTSLGLIGIGPCTSGHDMSRYLDR
jgi:hypothetical protein